MTLVSTGRGWTAAVFPRPFRLVAKCGWKPQLQAIIGRWRLKTALAAGLVNFVLQSGQVAGVGTVVSLGSRRAEVPTIHGIVSLSRRQGKPLLFFCWNWYTTEDYAKY